MGLQLGLGSGSSLGLCHPSNQHRMLKDILPSGLSLAGGGRGRTLTLVSKESFKVGVNACVIAVMMSGIRGPVRLI